LGGLADARPGDLVLSYKDGAIRAVSTVEGQAEDAQRPDPQKDKAWSDEGRMLKVHYRDLEKPVELADIPSAWQIEEDGPFDKNGAVKQGYFYHPRGWGAVIERGKGFLDG